MKTINSTMKITNIIAFTIVISCNNVKQNCKNMQGGIFFNAINPEIVKNGIGVPSNSLDAFSPGFNIRVKCKKCGIVSNNDFGFTKVSLWEKTKGFDFGSSVIYESKCKKCHRIVSDATHDIEVYDVIFSRCEYALSGHLKDSYSKVTQNMIFTDYDKTSKKSFYTIPKKLSKKFEYDLYDSKFFIEYRALKVRCSSVN